MSKLIFVTGVSGFLAAQIVAQLVDEGHRVRGTARGNKVEALRNLYKDQPSVEIVEVSDIAGAQFPEAFVGVDAVIHTASPTPGRAAPELVLKGAIEGSLNVLRQAEEAGIKKFVVTSSIAAVNGVPITDGKYSPDDWNPLTMEDAIDAHPFIVYEISKKYAELAVWEWAEAHPHVDVTTINPPFIYGPFATPSLPIAPGYFHGLSSNILVYNFVAPKGSYPPNPGNVDIRDVARAHTGALRTPASVTGRKRVILSSPHKFVYKDVIELLKRERPQLADRIIQTPPPEQTYYNFVVDRKRIEEVTGLRDEDFVPFEQMFLEGIDSCLQVEAGWKACGYTGTPFDIPPA
ncbi:hypothetical protein D9619_001331 [Psilocybe cf. subviscida]|uniref:NAD-dependent epimerase/dehydratase domain-containing protein n=1 Tax=Psilocybe cf. subviscida TaxID=2480587 RepID=A0A8H5BET8_9AGAR|nr:hypothetical protein D9619_001331 [Psilocybe cf. subviscida]